MKTESREEVGVEGRGAGTPTVELKTKVEGYLDKQWRNVVQDRTRWIQKEALKRGKKLEVWKEKGLGGVRFGC